MVSIEITTYFRMLTIKLYNVNFNAHYETQSLNFWSHCPYCGTACAQAPFRTAASQMPTFALAPYRIAPSHTL